MDEMTRLREMRADTPAPDRARLAAGRQRLADVTAKRSRRRALRTDWRLASLGAAAAAVVAVLIGVQIQEPGGGEPSPAASTVVTVPDLDDPVALVHRIADAAEASPDPNPEPGQWVYEKSVRGHESGSDEGEPGSGPQESWYLYADPQFENGTEGDDYSHRLRYDFVADLPEDPERLFAKLREFYPAAGPDEPRLAHDYRAARVLAGTWPVPPQGIARVYRALATLDGISAVDHLVADATGQKAIAVYVKTPGTTLRDELLFDPRTLERVGSRKVVVNSEDLPDSPYGDPLQKGDVLSNSAVLDHAMVGRENERP